MIFLFYFTLLDIQPERTDREFLLMNEAVIKIESGDTCGLMEILNSLKFFGYKKEADFLLGIYLLNSGNYKEAEKFLSLTEAPDYVKGMLSICSGKRLPTALMASLPDTLKFNLIFYTEDTVMIDSILSTLILPPVYKKIAEGYRLFLKGNYRKSSSIFKEVMGVCRKRIVMDYLFASLLGANNWKEIIELEERIKYDSPVKCFAVATAFYSLKKYSEAEKFFSAGTTSIYRVHFLYGLGWTEYRLRKYRKSVMAFNEFFREPIKKLVHPARYRLARAYLKLGDLKSLDIFKEIVRDSVKSSFDDDAMFLIGKVYFVINKEDSAKKYLLKTILDFPDSPWTPYAGRYLGDLFNREGDFKRAGQYYDLALKFNPPDKLKDELIYFRELMNYKQGKYRSTMEFYREFVNRYPDNSRMPEVMESMGELYINMGRYRKGIDVLKKLLEKPIDRDMGIRVVLKIFDAYQKIGKDEEGIGFVSDFIEKKCQDCDALYRALGEYYMGKDATGKAIEYFRKINGRELKPYALYMIGKAYFNTGFYGEAKVVLDEILTKFKDSPYYGRAYLLKLNSLSMEGLEEDLIAEFENMDQDLSMEAKREACLIVARYFCDREDERAIEYYLMAVECTGVNIQEQVKIYIEAADCAEKMGLLDKAEDLRNKAELLSR